MKKIILLLHLFLGSLVTYSQAPDFLWAKDAKGGSSIFGKSIVVDVNGNYYVTGYFTGRLVTLGGSFLDNAGSYDLFICKVDPTGSILWAKSAGGPDDDRSTAINIDATGCPYITGFFSSPSINFGGATLINSGGKDAFVVKYYTNGSVAWAKSAGGVLNDQSNSIAVDASDNVYLTGNFYSPSITFGTDTLANTDSLGSDAFVVKYNSSGNVTWVKGSNGIGMETGNGIALDAAGNAYVTGDYTGASVSIGTTTLVNAGISDVFIAKYDVAGNVLWAESLGGSLADNSTGIAVKANGDFYLTGGFNSSSLSFSTGTLTNVNAGTSDIFIAKYNALGGVTWAKNIGGTLEDKSTSVYTDTSGTFYLTGYFESATIALNSDTLFNSTPGTAEIFIAKYDNNGNITWARKAGGNLNDYSNGISVDKYGKVFITGGFYSAEVSLGNTVLKNTGGADLFIIRFTASGSPSMAKSEDVYSENCGRRVAADKNGNVYLFGEFDSPTITFDTITLTNKGIQDLFIVKYDSLGNVLWAKSIGGVGIEDCESVLGTGGSICIDSSGNFYVTGSFESPNLLLGNSTLFNNGSSDIFLMKGDATGNILWAKGIGGYLAEIGSIIDIDGAGNIYLAADFLSSQINFGNSSIYGGGAFHFFIAKYDSAGTNLWAKSISGGSSDPDNVNDIDVDYNGNIYLTGRVSDYINFGNNVIFPNGSEFLTVKFNTNGIAQWGDGGPYTCAGCGYFNARVSADDNGNSYVVYNHYIYKRDSLGNLEWTRNFTGLATDVFTDSNGEPYVTGETGDIDITFDTIVLTGNVGRDIFVVKYDRFGNAYWAKRAGGAFDEIPSCITIDKNGRAYIAGEYESTWANFDTITIVNSGANVFIAQLDSITSPPIILANIVSNVTNNTICSGDSITFTVTPINGGTNPTYQWQINNQNVGIDTMAFSSTGLNNGDTVTCIMKSNLPGISVDSVISNEIIMVVNSIPPTPVIILNGALLTSSAATGNQWYLNGAIISNATGQTYNANQNGNYTVIVTLNNCSSLESAPFNLISTEIDEIANLNTLAIHPNPYFDLTQIAYQLNQQSNVNIEVYNTIGQKVETLVNTTQTAGEYKYTFSAKEKGVGSGVYFVKIVIDGKVTIKKIVEME